MRLESDLNRRIRMIENDTAMSPEKKQAQIMQINALRNRAAEQAMAPR